MSPSLSWPLLIPQMPLLPPPKGLWPPALSPVDFEDPESPSQPSFGPMNRGHEMGGEWQLGTMAMATRALEAHQSSRGLQERGHRWLSK